MAVIRPGPPGRPVPPAQGGARHAHLGHGGRARAAGGGGHKAAAGLTTEMSPADLVAFRKPLFAEAANPHHYFEKRKIASIVPEPTLRMTPDAVASAKDWRALLGDLHLATPVGVIAARFHRGLARAVVTMADKLSGEERRFPQVALTGGWV